MALTKLTSDLSIIQGLPNQPKTTNGYPPETIKEMFDTAPNNIKTFLNETMTVEIDAQDAQNVKLTGAQTIAGVKTFSSSPVVPTPTTDMQASTKKYVDDKNTAQTSVLTTHKSSADHDSRYYTVTEIDAKVSTLNSADSTNATNLANHKSSGDHDGRYYTETESDAKFETKDAITNSRKLSPTGNFTGTLNGAPITSTDPGLSSTVNAMLGSGPAEEKANLSLVNAHLAGNTQKFSEVDADILALQIDKADKTEVNSLATQKANQTDLNATNATLALKADKSEVTNVLTPKGNRTYATLPTSGNTVGDYYYCPDGDGTHGKGNYVWNGATWYFGGTGDEGYNMLKESLTILHGNYGYVKGKTSEWGTNSVFYVNCALKKGEIIKGQVLNYNGSKFKNFRIVGYDSSDVEYPYPSNPNIGEVQNLKAKTDFVKVMFQINTTEIEVCDYEVFYTLEDAKTTNLVKTDIPRVYYVKKDGTGDFTKLTDAINEACKYMDSKVYVGAGTWDLIDELGSSYVESVSSTQRGLYLKNRVHVIFSSKALVTCHYTGTTANTITWLSAFNAGVNGFTLENLTLETSKCRYSIHDERDSDTDAYVNKYINCNIKHDNTNGGFRQCIGGGLGTDGYVVIDGCTFDNPRIGSVGDLVSYHNTAGIGKSRIEIKNSYFKRVFTFRFSWYGQSTEKSTMLACGNSIGASIIHQAETTDGTSPNVNTELIEWNNTVRVA